ncbi:ComEA family DNA-binding protein [bacterium]|nr:ComEA family DNA-binding protein [bacterium]
MKFFMLITLCASFLFATVDINTASKQELLSLKGIGEKKAEAIIEYRNANCFKNVDEISHVKGIGSKFLQKNRDNITAGECKVK